MMTGRLFFIFSKMFALFDDFSKWRVPNVMQLGKIIKYVKKFGGNEENNGIFTNNGHFWNQKSIKYTKLTIAVIEK